MRCTLACPLLQEDAYSKFMSDHGGHTNAYTSAEDTNYHFGGLELRSACCQRTCPHVATPDPLSVHSRLLQVAPGMAWLRPSAADVLRVA